MNRTRLLQTAGILFVIFLAIQFLRPPRENPVTDPLQAIAARVAIPPDVAATVRRACYDCHSNQTRWPWYSGVAPMSWLVVGHVTDGRQRLNFDDWNAHSPRRTTPPLDAICGQISQGKMPLPSYLLAHQDSKLSQADVAQLCAWTATLPSK
jgi:hypothetical protein